MIAETTPIESIAAAFWFFNGMVVAITALLIWAYKGRR